MLAPLLLALALAPLYWLWVPPPRRADAVTAGSLLALGLYDWRLLLGLGALVLALHGCLRALVGRSRGGRWIIAFTAFGVLLALFLANKLAAAGGGALSSQGGLVFLGVSYLVLKAAAIVSDTASGAREPPAFRTLLAWIVFLPTYPSGPIEDLDHFRAQIPASAAVPDRERIGVGLQRILFGAVKALVLAHYLGEWANGPLLDLSGSNTLQVWLATWAFTLRFFLDFSGYSDIAIGLAGVYGFEIQENFDRPLLRRNLVLLWQHWHMTLTRWLRVYLFVPISRAVMRRGGESWEVPAIAGAQLVTMTFCGLWHGVSWNFALWGALQAVGLVWVGLVAVRLGTFVPARLRAWWREHPVAHAMSVFVTFNAFSLSNVLVHSTLEQAVRIAAHLV